MPQIALFYGVIIRMFFYDIEKHKIPHIHAEYQGQNAVYSIIDGELLAGSLPTKKDKIVVAWIELRQEDLIANWNLAVNGQSIFQIKGLD